MKHRFNYVDLLMVFVLGAGAGFWGMVLYLLHWGCSCGF